MPIPYGKKHPTLVAWQEAGTTDPARIRHWWTEAPTHGIGIVTGEASNLVVVDVDEHGIVSGGDTLADLQATHGTLPATVEALTGGGGRHLYFAWPTGHMVRNDAGMRLGPGLDVRAEGGQVVAPPSMHASGRPYLWEASSDPDDVDVAPMPAWLVQLLEGAATDQRPPRERSTDAGTRPGDKWADSVEWADLLEADGATFLGMRLDHVSGKPYQCWSRPPMHGEHDFTPHMSATVDYRGGGVLKVFTSSWHGADRDTGEVWTLGEGATFTKFGYYATRHHGGDFRAARRAVEQQGYHADDPDDTASDTDPADPYAHLPTPMDFTTAWDRPRTVGHFLVAGFLPVGRQVILYAQAKEGKSLLALEVAAALATGRSVFGQPAQDPHHVIYCDFEMTEDDVLERLDDMGWGDRCDLGEFLHYYALPDLLPLDTNAGALQLMELVARHGADVVVLDTMSRVVSGGENDADTYLRFDRLTSRRLKEAGCACLRLDHSGKERERGQRGSSAKTSYADVVWEMTVNNEGIGNLHATHRRASGSVIPADISFTRLTEPFTEHHRAPIDDTWPPGIAEMAALCDAGGLPPDASSRAVAEYLKGTGNGRRRAFVVKLVKYRTQRLEGALGGSVPPRGGEAGKQSEPPAESSGTTSESGRSQTGTRPGTTGNHSTVEAGVPGSPPIGGNHPGTPPRNRHHKSHNPS
ncbi:MAG TPA: bifunctional DNA primase/polymerase, partial [Acidimicrobiales bacterium]